MSAASLIRRDGKRGREDERGRQGYVREAGLIQKLTQVCICFDWFYKVPMSRKYS